MHEVGFHANKMPVQNVNKIKEDHEKILQNLIWGKVVERELKGRYYEYIQERLLTFAHLFRAFGKDVL